MTTTTLLPSPEAGETTTQSREAESCDGCTGVGGANESCSVDPSRVFHCSALKKALGVPQAMEALVNAGCLRCNAGAGSNEETTMQCCVADPHCNAECCVCGLPGVLVSAADAATTAATVFPDNQMFYVDPVQVYRLENTEQRSAHWFQVRRVATGTGSAIAACLCLPDRGLPLLRCGAFYPKDSKEYCDGWRSFLDEEDDPGRASCERLSRPIIQAHMQFGSHMEDAALTQMLELKRGWRARQIGCRVLAQPHALALIQKLAIPHLPADVLRPLLPLPDPSLWLCVSPDVLLGSFDANDRQRATAPVGVVEIKAVSPFSAGPDEDVFITGTQLTMAKKTYGYNGMIPFTYLIQLGTQVAAECANDPEVAYRCTCANNHLVPSDGNEDGAYLLRWTPAKMSLTHFSLTSMARVGSLACLLYCTLAQQARNTHAEPVPGALEVLLHRALLYALNGALDGSCTEQYPSKLGDEFDAFVAPFLHKKLVVARDC